MDRYDLLDRVRKEGEDWGVIKGIFYCLLVEALSYIGFEFILWGIGA